MEERETLEEVGLVEAGKAERRAVRGAEREDPNGVGQEGGC